MLDIAIIGGGVCGLTLARALIADGHQPMLYEARPRLGGRIRSEPRGSSGGVVDLGPTWFWPKAQPLMTQLVAELGLATFSQHDHGQVLTLRDPDKPSDCTSNDPIHDGALRLAQGMTSLVTALRKDIPPSFIFLEHVLLTAEDRGDHVALRFATGETTVTVEARRVVLALPPRLLNEQVHFAPSLQPALRAAMRDVATWMAAQAKVVITYPRAEWRQRGYSGSAFVAHERAVFSEIFDACDAAAEAPALGAFLALPPTARLEFQRGLPILMDNQMNQVFGVELTREQQLYQDWATESFTCSERDRVQPDGHAESDSALLRQPTWAGKLLFAGAETGSYAGGYLEGALDAARRIKRELDFVAALSREPALCTPATELERDANAASFASFRAWLAPLGKQTGERYATRMKLALSQHRTDQLTQRALLGAVEEAFRQTLAQLEQLPLHVRGVAIVQGRSALTTDVQGCFDGFLTGVLEDVTTSNSASCALSNFPDEHYPPREYLDAMRRDLTAAWREFLRSANAVLVAKGLRAEP